MMHVGGKCFIYFIRPLGQDGPIKVGHSDDPAGRLASYLQWSPVRLEIAAVLEVAVPGNWTRRRFSMAMERRFHNRYRRFWLHHEWFAAHPQILADIEQIASGQFDLQELPENGPPIRTDPASAWGRAHQAEKAA